MPDSINRITGELQQGYSCDHCGDSCNMMATGHYDMKNSVYLCENKRNQFLSKERILEIEKELKVKGYI